MPNTQIEILAFKNWAGGLNLESHETQIAIDEMLEAQNVEIGLSGEVFKRKGYSAYSASHHANMGIGHFLFFWNQLGSTNDWFIYVDADGDVFAKTSTTWSDAAVHDFTAHGTAVDDWPIGFAIFENVAYLTSRRAANTVRFDGTSWTTNTDYTMDGSGSEFPRAHFLLAKHERLFAANINNNGTLERSRVRWSDVSEALNWRSDSWVDVQPDDGTQITGMVGFADGIVIFKEHSIHFLSGVDENSFTLFPVDSEIGCQSPQSIAVGEEAIYFLDQTRGVYTFDGTNVVRISDKINAALIGTSHTDAASAIFYAGFYFNKKYFLSTFTTGPANTWTFVYDTRHNAWTRWDKFFRNFSNRDALMYSVGPEDAVGIFLMNDTWQDNGSNYAVNITTGWMPLQAESVIAAPAVRFRGAEVLYGQTAAQGMPTALAIDLFSDYENGASVATTQDLQTGVIAESPLFMARSAPITSRPLVYRALKVKWSFTSNHDLVVNGVNLLVSKRRRLRRSAGAWV